MAIPLLMTLLLSQSQPVEGRITLRIENGLKAPGDLGQLLARCAAPRRLESVPAVELRVVRQAWLQAGFGAPKQGRRQGHYLPAKGGHGAIIYVAGDAELATSIAHELQHHLDAISGRRRSEAIIEAHARRCATR